MAADAGVEQGGVEMPTSWCADRRVALPGRPRERCLADAAFRRLLVESAQRRGLVGPGPQADWPRDEVIAARLAACGGCRHNADGVCLLQKLATPERPARIAVGVRIARACCPDSPPAWMAWPRSAAGDCG